MLTQRMYVPIALALALTSPSAAIAKAVGSVTIDRIETKSHAKGREVVIHASKAPTFSVFRLSDPFRVLVDINDARVQGIPELEKVDDGVVRYVSTNTFADETSAIVRVEIAIADGSEYHVRADGNSIVVEIGAPSARATAEEVAAPEQPSAQAKTPAVTKSDVASKPAVLGTLSKKKEKSRTTLSAKVQSGKVDPASVRIEQLDSPPRIVVHLDNAEINPKWQKLDVDRFGVKRARIGSDETGVKMVLDLENTTTLPKIDVDQVKGQLAISLSKAPKVAKAKPVAEVKPEVVAVAEEAPVTKVVEKPAAPAPIEEAPAAATRAATMITDVKFEPKDGFMRLTVTLSNTDTEAVRVSAARQEAPMLRLANTSLPAKLERTLDVSEVAGEIVQSISTYREGNDLLIAAAIGGGVEHRHWRKDNRLMWDFRGPSSAEGTTVSANGARVITYPEQATSGYQSTAVQITSALSGQESRYRGRRISLDLKDAEIQNVLRLLADVSKLNIVASDDVRGKITIKLRNVPWDQALDIILHARGLDKTRIGNIVRVAPVDVLRKEEELRIERRKAQVELEPLSVRLIPVSYAVASEVKPQATALLSPRGKVNIDIRTNVLVVEDIAEVLTKVERLVRTLDTQTPQVLIEARIVEANTSFSRDLGIQWGGQTSLTSQYGTSTGLAFPNQVRIAGAADDGGNNVTEAVLGDPNYVVNLPAAIGSGAGGGLGFIFGSAGGSALVSLRLSAAESQGKVKIVSSPKIITLDNKEARILSGEKVPITVITANGPSTRFIDANIELAVTPHVTQDGSVLLNIRAAKNELSGRRDLLGTPGILTKEAQTEMLVRDGDTAVLGGLYRRTAVENKAYVPWIGQIPVLGWLFKTTSKSDAREELLIFVTPRIVNRSQALVSAQ